ncbi:MAG TPA: aminotransferase class I/II-fold pyridoxal phosphate-dependent enzyme, partial [Longimicrobium sp.]|nr:aminotransferase class I/II-fold pyridoxal phosphate-dependent enzyme [Longimicrobium sp.]
MKTANDALKAAFDPDAFRAEAHRVVDLLADYLRQARSGDLPVLPWVPPEELAPRWPARFPQKGGGDLPALLHRVVEEANHLHHPRFVGHQVSAPLPSTALCDMVSALLNNGMAIYEMGPSATAMEKAVLAWMAERLGLPASAGGVLTSGGSAGNLTALLAARQAKAGFNVWDEGASGGPPLAILVADQAHYCVERSARMMGLGAGGVVKVPVDPAFRMRADLLPEAFDKATREGRRVFAVVASACSTATGAFDPLEPIADFCQARGLWLHVDGAHGASAVLSPRHRGLLRGVERADSVVWDAHKMMMTPALVTAVLFREARRSFEAFAQEASYLYDEARAGHDEWNVGTRTLECTKRMMGLKLY